MCRKFLQCLIIVCLILICFGEDVYRWAKEEDGDTSIPVDTDLIRRIKRGTVPISEIEFEPDIIHCCVDGEPFTIERKTKIDLRRHLEHRPRFNLRPPSEVNY